MTSCLLLLLVSTYSVLQISFAQDAPTSLFPGMIIFGDSVVDVGNNNYLPTLFRADYPPYGRDFAGHKPTGRFCNGKLATDITGNKKSCYLYLKLSFGVASNWSSLCFCVTAETLGFTKYPPAYLSPEASGKNLLIGANFASAASGYDDKAALLNVSDCSSSSDTFLLCLYSLFRFCVPFFFFFAGSTRFRCISKLSITRSTRASS